MKSKICTLNKNIDSYNEILNEVENILTYNKIEGKQALRIRLIAEELIGMVRGLVDDFEGMFWIENNGSDYEFHVNIKVDEMNIEKREELIAVSKTGKNAAATGIMGKIRAVAETMMLVVTNPNLNCPVMQYYDGNDIIMGVGYLEPEIAAEYGYLCSWSLNNYKTKTQEATACDELERSIVANLANDIIVGVKGKNVEIIIKKTV